MKRFGVILATLMGGSAIAFAEVQLPVGQFDPESVTTIEPGLFPGVPETVDREGRVEPIKGIRIDLNGDGKLDLVQEVYQNCGTGGCSFDIYDGASSKRVGRNLFGGRFFVSKTKINGWPVLEEYSHASSQGGAFSSYVYDGSQYVRVSSVSLYGRSVNELFQRYDSVPRIEP